MGLAAVYYNARPRGFSIAGDASDSCFRLPLASSLASCQSSFDGSTDGLDGAEPLNNCVTRQSLATSGTGVGLELAEAFSSSRGRGSLCRTLLSPSGAPAAPPFQTLSLRTEQLHQVLARGKRLLNVKEMVRLSAPSSPSAHHDRLRSGMIAGQPSR